MNSSSHAVAMDDDMENGSLSPYPDRPRRFPSMRSKSHTPLVNSVIQFHLKNGCNIFVKGHHIVALVALP